MNGFLLDENLPRRLTFNPSLPVTSTVSLGESPTDTAIWEHASDQRLVIVTKDPDFSARVLLTSSRPWVVHVRFGNLRSAAFHELLARLWPEVESRLPMHKLICLYSDRIEAIADHESP